MEKKFICCSEAKRHKNNAIIAHICAAKCYNASNSDTFL